MFTKIFLCLCFALLCQFIVAQENSNINLEEVVVSDVHLLNDNKSQTIQVLNDSVIEKNQSSITELLKNNTVIYFKENGSGGSTAVSFRGTTANHTAMIWNGININSYITGQTDFSTVNAYDFSSVSIKAGGGSVNYGTGAIGGTIHLGNELSFKDSYNAMARTDYGSFNTVGINAKVGAANKKWSWQTGFFYKKSDNDYPYKEDGEDKKNFNGQYKTASFNGSVGYKFNENSIIKFYNQTSQLDRNFPLMAPYEITNKAKNMSSYSRNLLEYELNKGRFNSSIKTVFLYEELKYINEIDNPNDYQFNRTKNIITKAEAGYKIVDKLKLSGFADYSYIDGYGDNFENGKQFRRNTSLAAILKYNTTERWQNEAGVRGEYSDNYKSPLLFSLGTSYLFGKVYNLKANISKNYRIPTFSDLFWKKGAYSQGNPNLKPETSLQGEIGNVFNFKNFSITETFYINDITDLIQWVPAEEGSYVYIPRNVDKVLSYGAETMLNWRKDFGYHHINISGTYAYTKSEDKENNKQLIYVPFHKTTASAAYTFKKISANYQFLNNGSVYVQNNEYGEETLPSYSISNLGIDYETGFLTSTRIGFQVLNIFDKQYENLKEMYMPGRSFNVYLKLAISN